MKQELSKRSRFPVFDEKCIYVQTKISEDGKQEEIELGEDFRM